MNTPELFEHVATLVRAAMRAAGVPARRIDGAPWELVVDAAGVPARVRARRIHGAPAWASAVCDAAAALRLFAVQDSGETDAARDARWLAGAPALIETLCAAYAGVVASAEREAMDALRGAKLVVRGPAGAL